MTKLKHYCNKVIFWPQYGPVCWFNAVLISVFYSQYSRSMLYKMSDRWDMKIEFYKILRFVLKHKYLRSKNPEKDFKFFDIMRAENILQMIHKINPKYATGNMWTHGAWSNIIIHKVYKLLGVKCLMLEVVQNRQLYYDRRNHLELIPKTDDSRFDYKHKVKSAQYIQNKLKQMQNPDVLILNTVGNDIRRRFYMQTGTEGYNIHVNYNNKDLLTFNDKIMYNGEEYILDSVIVANYNSGNGIKGHAISGITCDNTRYVYNGWMRFTQDSAMKHAKGGNVVRFLPCELLKLKWDVKKDFEFCINLAKCALPKAKKKDHNKNMCFSFAKGERTFIYIKKNVSANIPVPPVILDYKSYNKDTTIVDDKIKNPATNRYIKKESAIKKNLVKPDKPVKGPKICPEGKMLNPKTNRCVKKLSAKPANKPVKAPKICPEGKMLNPKTNRCVKKKTSKPKICPEGKMLNPKTNRCVKRITS